MCLCFRVAVVVLYSYRDDYYKILLWSLLSLPRRNETNGYDVCSQTNVFLYGGFDAKGWLKGPVINHVIDDSCDEITHKILYSPELKKKKIFSHITLSWCFLTCTRWCTLASKTTALLWAQNKFSFYFTIHCFKAVYLFVIP